MHSEVKPRKRDRLRSLLTKSSPPLIESSASDSSPTHLSPRTAGTSDTSEPEEESRTGRLASPKEDAKVGRRRSLNLDSSKRSIWGSSQRNAKSREASPDRSGLTSLRRSATTKAKISTEQAQYIKSVLAEVPSPTGLSPLDLLRVAQPLHLRQGPNTPISPDAKPSSADERLTGLYAALQRFTAVEVLEKDNAFQCRKCWRAEHPEFARPKRRPKTFQHAHSPLATPNTQERDDDTPSGTNVEPSRVALKDATSSLQQLQMVDRRVESSATDPVKSPSIHSKELLPSITIDSSAESNGSIGLSPTVSTTHTSYYASSDVESPGNSDAEDSAAIKSNPRLKRPPKAERFIARRAHKRFLISHLPPMLIIHFNRFQQTKNSIFTSSIFSNLKKIDDFVSFPLILNMAPFLAPLGKPPKETDEKKEHGSLLPRFWASHKLLHQDERLKHSKYRLSAIVVHTGTMGSGHYITFVQATKTKPVKRVELEPDQLNSKSSSGDLAEESTTSLSAVDEMQATKVKEQEKEEVKEVASNWLYCSDEEVRPANITEVLNCKAYLLLYEQI
jgi:ubiquitin carboxyl-terminal hydrolase 16/45